jgi:[protein-PII] uridylyltransferase
VAGDHDLVDELASAARAQWERRARRWLAELATSVDARHERSGEVAFMLEPDLKEGRGGLRDVHALGWAEAAHRVMLDYDRPGLDASYSMILDARVELQRRTGRSGNRLVLEEQAGVAEALRLPSTDALMTRVAAAASTIAWTSDDAWRRVRSTLRSPVRRLTARPRSLAPDVFLTNGEVALAETADAAGDPLLTLLVASLAAAHEATIDRDSLERLATEAPALPEPWPEEARRLFVDLLLAGRPAIRVIEALDQRSAWTAIVREWASVRARPQHNAYHRFTVDRHLLETVANAAALAECTSRPDLLVVGALLHDLGKGAHGDHTVAGMDIADTAARRMGFPEADVASLVALVRHHLLLPDVATRRDLNDPATVNSVAAAVGSLEALRLLAALTEADSVATGPSAWSPWKKELLTQLVDRAAQVLEGVEPDDLGIDPFPSPDQLALLTQPGRTIEAAGNSLTVVADDRPGLFSRVAGVLALHGLDVLSASAHSSDGRALAEFRVSDPFRDETPWARVTDDLERVLDGRLALHARLAARARTYGRNPPALARLAVAAVTFDNEASNAATVIDVHAPNRIGVLYRITRALADLDLDIRSAKAETMGAQAVDSFYVRDSRDAKIDDGAALAEIETAILHSLTEWS